MAPVQWCFTFGVLFAVMQALTCSGTLEKELYCKDPDTGKFHPINSTWPSTTFCGNYTCKVRSKNGTSTQYIPKLVIKDNQQETNGLKDDNTNENLKLINETKMDEVLGQNEEAETIQGSADDKNRETKHKKVTEFKEDSIENIILEGYANQFKAKVDNFNHPAEANSIEKIKCNDCDVHKHEPINIADRYLTKEEVNTIAAFLYSVKKSDLDTLVEMYKIANDLYSEMESSATEDTFSLSTESKKVKAQSEVQQPIATPYYIHGVPNSYFYDSSTFTPNKLEYYTQPYAKSVAQYPFLYSSYLNPNNINADYSTNHQPQSPTLVQQQQANRQQTSSKSPLYDNVPQGDLVYNPNRPIILTPGSVSRSNHQIQPKPISHNSFNEMRASASKVYVHPYAFYNNMPSVLQQSNLNYAGSNAAEINVPVVFKHDQGSNEESVFGEFSVQPQQQIPYLVSSQYPFGIGPPINTASVPEKLVPISHTQRIPEITKTLNKNNPYVPFAPIRQGSPLQYLNIGNAYKRMYENLRTQTSPEVSKVDSKAPLFNSKNAIDTSNKNNGQDSERKLSWKTAPLSLQTLENVRAHVVHKTPSFMSREKRLESMATNPFNRMKMERVGTVLRLDGLTKTKREAEMQAAEDKEEHNGRSLESMAANPFNRMKRVGTVLRLDRLTRTKREAEMQAAEEKEEYNEIMETYLTTTGCELDTEPGFFRTGDNSKPFPKCCPQRLDD